MSHLGSASIRFLLVISLAFCLSCLARSAVIAGPQTARYVGKLNPELVPTPTLGFEKPMTPASETDRKSLPVALASEDEMFVGSLAIWTSKGLRLAFVRPKSGSPHLYADTNSNGTFEESERHPLIPMKDSPEVEGAAMLYRDFAHGHFSNYPIRIAILKPGSTAECVRPASSMEIVFAEGKVDVQGRQVLVSYTLDTETGTVDPDSGFIGMDCNGDGTIDRSPNSPEWRFANKNVVVFRVGEHYLSTESVDLSSGKIVLRSHPATAYTSIELQLQRKIADFPFTDFDGVEHRFSEFRGRYLLLDVWATWCSPCVAEIPFLKSNYEKYKKRGFEILGLDYDEELGAAKKFIAERGITWPQATRESIKDHLTVYVFPTTVLLDPYGKIISMGSDGELRGENLEATLEKLLPDKHP